MSEPEAYLSKKTKRGIFVLVTICLAIIYTPRFLYWMNPSEKLQLTYTEVVNSDKLNAFKGRAEFKKRQKYTKKSKFKRPPRKFNPNDYSQSQWMQLGLSEKQAIVVLKFTQRKLRSNEDLKKIFVIPETLFEMIKDSTFYPEIPTYKNDYEKKSFTEKLDDKYEQKLILLELNISETEDLTKVPGIGPFFAKMIVKRRNELGGFVQKEQLLEVFKMDAEKYASIEKYLRVNPDIVTKFNLNQVTLEELVKHPYIDYKVANSIVKMRDQKGGYKTVDELKESVLISHELFQKLKPYVYL